MTTGTPSTPAGRQVVVVRAGPPKRRGAFIDAVVGILGVMLLIAAGVLGETLPEEDVIAVQYLPEFPTTNVAAQLMREGGTNSSEALRFDFQENEAATVLIQIPHDNVVSISMQAFLEGDDIGSSLPDAFKFTLYGPDGDQVGEVFKVNTAQPKQRDNTVPGPPIGPGTVTNTTDPIYVSGSSNPATAWRLGAPPNPEFIGGEGKKLDHTAALSIAIDRYTQPTNGTWTMVVELTNAGDCPQPSPSGQNDRYLECMRMTGNSGQDPGNSITVKFVRYDYYTIELPDPQAESPDAI